MKTFFISVIALFILSFANSCKKCSNCRKYPEKDVQICKKDYASDDSYAQVFRYQEALGYDCE